jgi:NAD(P)-dependent dehydrogenase (short-subunit alcohol dehydrogenase family)
VTVPRPGRPYRAVAITGGGTGLGREIALGFAAKDCIVFGTALAASEVQDLKVASAGRVSLAVCDITRPDAARAWASGVSDALDGAGLDILISNVGISTPGPIETLPLDTIRHAFEVNVFGALKVINAFLPALRMARGRIVQISSWTASVPLPFDGPSAASKAAIDVLSSVYRAELKPHGVDVVTVVASDMKADASARKAPAALAAGSMTAEHRKLYGKAFGIFVDRMNSVRASAMAAADAAASIIEIAERQPAPELAAVGPDAEEILRAFRSQTDAEMNALRKKLIGQS